MTTGQMDDAKVQPAGFLAMLPSFFRGQNRSRPNDLIGATIVRFGTIPGEKVEGGGLVIDYKPVGSDEAKRIVFGFNELGMWVDSEELISVTTDTSNLAAIFGDQSQAVLDDIRRTDGDKSLTWEDISECLKDPSQYAYEAALPQVIRATWGSLSPDARLVAMICAEGALGWAEMYWQEY